MTASLSDELGAAEHHHEGAGRVGGELAQHRHLGQHQVPAACGSSRGRS